MNDEELTPPETESETPPAVELFPGYERMRFRLAAEELAAIEREQERWAQVRRRANPPACSADRLFRTHLRFVDRGMEHLVPVHRLLVVAGSQREYEQWCHLEGYHPQECHYLRDLRRLRGLRLDDFLLIRVGEWWLNPILNEDEFHHYFPEYLRSPIFTLGHQSSNAPVSHQRPHVTVQLRVGVDELPELFNQVRQVCALLEQGAATALRPLLELQENLVRHMRNLSNVPGAPKTATSCTNCAYHYRDHGRQLSVCNALHVLEDIDPNTYCCSDWRTR